MLAVFDMYDALCCEFIHSLQSAETRFKGREYQRECVGREACGDGGWCKTSCVGLLERESIMQRKGGTRIFLLNVSKGLGVVSQRLRAYFLFPERELGKRIYAGRITQHHNARGDPLSL